MALGGFSPIFLLFLFCFHIVGYLIVDSIADYFTYYRSAVADYFAKLCSSKPFTSIVVKINKFS